jgi:hypothetical protein
VHLGDPALDLSLGWTDVPPGGRGAFFGAYGAADPDALRRARFRALFQALGWIAYGLDIGDADLVAEGRRALAWAGVTRDGS